VPISKIESEALGWWVTGEGAPGNADWK